MLTRRRFLQAGALAALAVVAERLMPSALGSGYAVTGGGGGGGGGGLGGGGAVYDLMASPDFGAWGAIQQPRAVSYNGYTYVGFVKPDGSIHVVAVNETTQAVTVSSSLRTLSGDDH